MANHLIQEGWDVDIVTLLGDEVERAHFSLSSQIRIIDIHPVGHKPYSRNVLHWLRRIRQVVHERRPDVIISFFGRINALVLTATIGKNIPTVVSERNDPKRDGRGKLMQKYCDCIYRRASAIVFQTNYEQSCFSPVHANKSHVIHNPVEMLDVNNNPIDKNLIVAVGRLEEQKNHLMLIEAMEIVRKRLPEVKCEIYGSGTLHDAFQRYVNKHGLHDCVVFEGKRSDVLNCISKARAFVMTSNFEGLSNALMEAMMLGKICISTDYDGIEDLITDGENGVIVPRNDVGRLADVLTDIIQDREGKYDEMGKNARKRISAFESTIILNQWNKLLESVLE